MHVMGIDIGGSGIKGAPADLEKGALAVPRHRIATPQPSTPQAVAEVVGRMVKGFAWQGPVGVTFPAVVQHGVTLSAANVDKAWIGAHAEELFRQVTGLPVTVLNDADAAGMAEMRYGAGRDQKGVVLLLTFGTGIGSALFTDGILVPNTELGHLEIGGRDAEDRAASSVRTELDLSWKQWARRVDRVLGRIEMLFSPDLIIVGGGISKEHTRFFPYLTTRAPLVPAQLYNDAGIIGAALAAAQRPEATGNERVG